MRKALGAATPSVIAQDLVQTAVAVLTAIIVALASIVAFSRFLEDRWRVVILPPWSTLELWALLAGLLVTMTIAAGAYPAAVLARTNPSTALRLGTAKGGSRVLRTILVGTQFASAAFLIIAGIVFYWQAQAVRSGALDRFADQYVVIPYDLRGLNRVDFDVVHTELMRGAGIKGVAGINGYPYSGSSGARPVSRSMGEQQAAPRMQDFYVTHDYFAVMDVPLLAGRSFSKDRADDALPRPGEQTSRVGPPRIVIDRSAAGALGWSNPQAAIGELIYTGQSLQSRLEIIGVVESLPLALRNQGDSGSIYWLAPHFASTTLVRTASTDIAPALAHIDEVAKRIAPNAAVQRRFLNEIFESSYAAFTMANRMVYTLAALAAAIAGIGLFGMASFMTRRRIREIGLRKAQGAASAQILQLLLWDFTKPVLIANVVVWPLAYIAARAYLELFRDRMPLTPLPFVATLIATVLLAWLVVGAQVTRAARLNPAIALRQD